MSPRSHRILVAHESETIREAIRQLLDNVGYTVRAVEDGTAVIKAAQEDRYGALVLDVAVPRMLAYEVVDEIRRTSPETRIVLVASIYNRTGYKRRPTSLYGADDYVEQHHIPDALLGKLIHLVGEPTGGVATARIPAHADTPEGRAIKAAGEQRLQPFFDGVAREMDAVKRAERLARLIVADIALYNGDALADVDGADLPSARRDAEVEARLRIDLEEGRLLFDLRVPESVRRARDFIGEALAELRHKRASEDGP